MPTTINHTLIEETVNSFPRKSHWKFFEVFNLRNEKKRTSYKLISHLKRQAGVYAWLFPDNLLNQSLRIKLHGPRTSGNVDFLFSSRDLPRLADKRVVMYVGRASDLYKRIQQHLRPSGRTSFQVGKGLVYCRIAKNKNEAREMLFKHARIYYTILYGKENTVNRDLIEAALYSKYRAPFNVKSEH
jgi:hypothetical protein